jgi:hypothetical protein
LPVCIGPRSGAPDDFGEIIDSGEEFNEEQIILQDFEMPASYNPSQ